MWQQRVEPENDSLRLPTGRDLKSEAVSGRLEESESGCMHGGEWANFNKCLKSKVHCGHAAALWPLTISSLPFGSEDK